MGWWRKVWGAARAADTTLSLLNIAFRVIVSGTVLGLATGIVTWIVANPVIAVVLGMAVWIAVAMLLLVVLSYRTQSAAHLDTKSAPEPGDGSLPFPLPRPLPPDWESRRTLSNLSFRLVDLIDPEQVLNQTYVRDKSFYRCTIHGPAILIPIDTRFDGDNEFQNEPRSQHPQSMLYFPKPVPNRTWWSGTVATRECVFRNCTFVDIGFMHDESNLARLRDHIEGKGDVQTS